MLGREREQVHLGTGLGNGLAGLMILSQVTLFHIFSSHLGDKSFILLCKHHLAKEASKKNTTFVVCLFLWALQF